MRTLNTLPIEDFLEKSKIAKKSNQKSLTLSSKEYTDLYDSLAAVMTRLAGSSDQSSAEDTIEVKMDGGGFR
jgi:hypothetical protein